MAVSLCSRFRVYDDQLLCAGAVLGACCLAPVQTKRAVLPLFAEKHNGSSTLLLSALIVLLVASGMSLVGPEGPWMSLQGCLFQDFSLRISPQGFLLLGSSSGIPPPACLFKDSSSRVPFPGFHLKDSSCWIPLTFLRQDTLSRIPPQGFLSQDFTSRVLP